MQIADMASTGKETTFCMGDDAPLGPTLPASMPHALGRPHTLGRMPAVHATTYVFVYCYTRVLILLFMRPHILYTSSCIVYVLVYKCRDAMYVSSYVRVLMLLYMCPPRGPAVCVCVS
jgi:hypothetical protein